MGWVVLVSGGGGGIVAFGLFGHQRGRPLILLVVIVITCVCVCVRLCACVGLCVHASLHVVGPKRAPPLWLDLKCVVTGNWNGAGKRGIENLN